MNILVTGGSSGIGLEVSRMLIERSHVVFSLSRTKSAWVNESFFQYNCDIANSDQVDLVFSQLLLDIPSVCIDGIFLNSGTYSASSLDTINRDQFQEIFGVNFFGNLYVLSKAYKLMRSSTIKSVVINSSDQVNIGKRNSILYGASKAAISHLTKTLTADYSTYGLRVNAVLPGGTRTDMYQTAQEGKSESDILDSQSKYPLNRIAEPCEIAELVVFLLGPESSFIAGAEIPIDGGLSIV
jgi:NAD(P)-dependent dehydrogenase (short-subunit alcohol dehydrogenase family)